MEILDDILCCPRCRARLCALRCSNETCIYSTKDFPLASGQPVLIDFEDSIFTCEAYTDGRGSVLPRPVTGSIVGQFLRKLTYGSNVTMPGKSVEMLHYLRGLSPNPVLLVIGGGTVGSGASALYESSDIQIVGTDAYASPNTVAVCDAHRLPFADQSFDGVLIQAVIEHVLEPHRVVNEVYRVLKSGGIVYADTPFMQQVHEGAYDFTRFTLTGHRWLFRHFEHIDSGLVGGAGTALIWSIAYFFRSFGASNKVASLLAAPFFWVRWLERYAKRGPAADGASGVYFFGAKAADPLKPSDLLNYYASQREP